ncbi:outer membrane protein [Tabrizicola sp.]|uniref:outer membrane protein n=1 Tax=Tabrizicola sp. TaxID=2005166 RepID=UPI00273359BD|nr:outer membrane beta-barrel protein [Tabrizicola sp.]MDP3194457.1 outer membrane beta-barrel protein [Tabrizicola sp.]
MTSRSGPLAAAGILCVIACSAALAGGPVETAPAVSAPAEPAPLALAVPEDWSGFYIGIAAARPRGDNTWRLNDLDLSLIPSDWSGTLPILTLGRDWQRGRLTFGAALSLANGEISASPQSDLFLSCFRCDTVVSDLITLRGRAGLATGKMHYFATGGFAQADVAGTSGAGATTVNSATLTGWTLGLGVERRIAEKLSLTASYDHADLGALDLSGHVAGTDSSIDFSLMQIGVNYRW